VGLTSTSIKVSRDRPNGPEAEPQNLPSDELQLEASGTVSLAGISPIPKTSA
jgi:hypothetical protein